MKMQLITEVNGSVAAVFARMDRHLLESLAPPGMSLQLKRFDEPTRPGSLVEIQTKVLGILPQFWRTEITEFQAGTTESFFTDEGRILPFPMTRWKHRHIVRTGNQSTEIVDEVEFSAGWLSWLMYPVIWLQFAWRQPRYKSYFQNLE